MELNEFMKLLNVNLLFANIIIIVFYCVDRYTYIIACRKIYFIRMSVFILSSEHPVIDCK